MENKSGEAKVQKVKNWSPVWIFPIVTALIGAWILFYHYSHQGPEVTLITTNAEGIEDGKTTIKSRSVDVGVVESATLTDDLTHVEIKARLNAGMEKLLAEELESKKMRFTLELKDKRVKETALDAEAQKVRREKAAEAAANEQIIAARAQEEAMKHVLPFKQKQIEQRQLEAEAERLARVKAAEGAAQARRIEANGEADSRQKLADAEAYRLDRVGKVASEQMAREGALISKHPLLIQKTMADKLSDKISVIIAPPSTNGDFIGASLLGTTRNGKTGTEREEQVSRNAGSDKEAE